MNRSKEIAEFVMSTLGYILIGFVVGSVLYRVFEILEVGH
jgi:hypothetical protein